MQYSVAKSDACSTQITIREKLRKALKLITILTQIYN